MNTVDFEPIKPDPNWKQVNSTQWQSENNSAQLRNFGPADYARGFEDGAYAMADTMFDVIREHGLQGAIRLLSVYRAGNAHPIRGWKGEPNRG